MKASDLDSLYLFDIFFYRIRFSSEIAIVSKSKSYCINQGIISCVFIFIYFGPSKRVRTRIWSFIIIIVGMRREWWRWRWLILALALLHSSFHSFVSPAIFIHLLSSSHNSVRNMALRCCCCWCTRIMFMTNRFQTILQSHLRKHISVRRFGIYIFFFTISDELLLFSLHLWLWRIALLYSIEANDFSLDFWSIRHQPHAMQYLFNLCSIHLFYLYFFAFLNLPPSSPIRVCKCICILNWQWYLCTYKKNDIQKISRRK